MTVRALLASIISPLFFIQEIWYHLIFYIYTPSKINAVPYRPNKCFCLAFLAILPSIHFNLKHKIFLNERFFWTLDSSQSKELTAFECQKNIRGYLEKNAFPPCRWHAHLTRGINSENIGEYLRMR